MSNNREKQIAVLVDTATGWGRRMVRGIIRYANQRSHWHLWIEARGQDEPLHLPPGWSGDGILARVATRPIAREVEAASVPTVNVSAIELGDVQLPRVTSDVVGSAEMAVQHFTDRGLKHFAYCGPNRIAWVGLHCDTFVDSVNQSGFECSVYRPRRGAGKGWKNRRADMARWLANLPKPVGILTWANRVGRELIEVCRENSILVPEQVAILAGDDDDLLCETCSPPLSGIQVDSEQIGYRAAELLDRMIDGRKTPKQSIRVPPLGICARRSTEVLAIDQPELALAVRFIREHASEPICVADVLKAVPMSRRELERQFQRVLARSPAAEIRRVHLERAKDLLTNTDQPIPEVARRSGFGSPEYLAQVFRREFNISPLKYRIQIRGG
ncbi:AraC family transcriptional regulator [Rhodopirellula sallentina]|uniref:Xylose operon regulatory protein n=1 Tax=Rhodopirellula sallentina SM41 TaxID=1263870 RepID=M5U919_9BACT|nr:DNA-binding transcriptional regulator [Rhodopirellula sallentina]EMI57759.1 xylose operon regulatory protein [Rhodopirellula sallentina SM41]